MRSISEKQAKQLGDSYGFQTTVGIIDSADKLRDYLLTAPENTVHMTNKVFGLTESGELQVLTSHGVKRVTVGEETLLTALRIFFAYFDIAQLLSRIETCGSVEKALAKFYPEVEPV